MNDRIVLLIARCLTLDEREAVLGDIAECREPGRRAIAGLLGLVIRRQAMHWRSPSPWLALASALPLSFVVSRAAARVAFQTTLYTWLYAANWSSIYIEDRGFRKDFSQTVGMIAVSCTELVLLVLAASFIITRISQRAACFNAALFCFLTMIGENMFPRYFLNDSAISNIYRVVTANSICAFFVILPVAIVTRLRLRRKLAAVSVILLLVPFVMHAADKTAPPGKLVPAGERNLAPEFRLTDADGKTAELKQYRGKVVLLDFWATWCHGCKEEIPWFAEYQKRYGPDRVAVIGASMDEGGWKVLKPFLATNHVPYRMVLADDALAKRYGIETLPDTFLIDRNGRIAAAYKARLIDRADVGHKIEELLKER